MFIAIFMNVYTVAVHNLYNMDTWICYTYHYIHRDDNDTSFNCVHHCCSDTDVRYVYVNLNVCMVEFYTSYG